MILLGDYFIRSKVLAWSSSQPVYLGSCIRFWGSGFEVEDDQSVTLSIFLPICRSVLSLRDQLLEIPRET